MATKDDSRSIPAPAPTSTEVYRLSNSHLPQVKRPKRRGKLPTGVASIEVARAAAQSRANTLTRSVRTDLDEVTRDLHAAASTALKMVTLMRRDLGLAGL